MVDIGHEILQEMNQESASFSAGPAKKPVSAKGSSSASGHVIRPDMSIRWRPGDKARHGKWGVGTVVSVEGSGEETLLKIAFPDQGVKGLMQKYAPICRA